MNIVGNIVNARKVTRLLIVNKALKNQFINNSCLIIHAVVLVLWNKEQWRSLGPQNMGGTRRQFLLLPELYRRLQRFEASGAFSRADTTPTPTTHQLWMNLTTGPGSNGGRAPTPP